MINKFLLPIFLIFLATSPLTQAGKKSHPLLPAYPGADLENELVMDYEVFDLPTGLPDTSTGKKRVPTVKVLGDLSQYHYEIENVSTTKAFKNYQQALKSKGFIVGFECELEACGDRDTRMTLGDALASRGRVYNYHHKPYSLIGHLEGSKGKVHVGLFVGGYDEDTAVQLTIIEEEPLDTSLIKLNTTYLNSQPAATVATNKTARDLDKDHPLFSRYPGANLQTHQKVDYDQLKVAVSLQKKPNGQYQIITEEMTGDIARHNYMIDNVSSLKIYQNYREALTSAGFSIDFECKRDECGEAKKLGAVMSQHGNVYNYYRKPYFIVGRLQGPKGLVYASMFIGSYEDETNVHQTIIETEAKETGLVTANADSLKRELEENGKASIYGIHFDVDKASIRSESRPALDEIAKLLKQNPALNIYVVGHTDDTGDLDHNLQLSSMRASAVRNDLVSTYGIANARLTSRGVGPFAPESNNTSNKGKQLNRRVELVKRLN